MKKIIQILILCFTFTTILNASKTILFDNESNLFLTQEEKDYLKNKQSIKIANSEDLPPFNFNENGIPKGYSIEYMNLVGKILNIKIDYVSDRTWNEYLLMLKNKEIDIIPHVAVNNERKEYIDFTNFNHIEYTTGMAIEKNSDIKSLEDLRYKITAVANNSFIHNFLKKKYPSNSLLLISSSAKALDAVSLNQAHAVIGSLPTLNYYIQKNWLTNIKIVNIDNSEISAKTSLPMGVPKGETILKSILEKVDLAISYNEIANLKQKWMNSNTYSNELSKDEVKYLKDKKTIKMCVLPDWLPFENIDENGKHGGIGADVIKKVEKYIETPIELVLTKEWSSSLQNIRDRKCDILPVAMNVPSRRDSMNFTLPYFSEPFVVATKNDKLFIKSSEDLNGKKIGIVKSYAFIEVLKAKNPLIEIISVKNPKEGLQKVSDGELFGYVDTMPTIGYEIQKYGMVDLKIAGKLEFDITLSIASRNDEIFLNSIMQKSLDSINKDEMRTIVGKWIEVKVAQEFNYTILWQITGFFLFIVLAVLYKNRAVILLNRELIKIKNEIEEQQKMVDKYVLILSTNTKGIITDVNEAFCRATGYTKDELINQKYTILRKYDKNDNTFIEIKKFISTNKSWSGEIKNIKKNQEDIWFNMYIEPIIKNNNIIGFRTISENITDKKRIEELSVTDKLTGLSNRLKLDEIMLIKIEEFRRHKIDFSIIVIDIDNFKEVNDNYGHDIGDYVLQTIAKILRDNTRKIDIVGRWGGEEFLIICSNTNLQNATILAENLRKIIKNIKFNKIGHKTVSLGLAQYKEDDDFKTIFKRADEALYKAKTTGKDKVCF